MVRRIAILVAALATSLFALAPAASAGGYVCYDASVTVNGDAVVDESGCQDLP